MINTINYKSDEWKKKIKELIRKHKLSKVRNTLIERCEVCGRICKEDRGERRNDTDPENAHTRCGVVRDLQRPGGKCLRSNGRRSKR